MSELPADKVQPKDFSSQPDQTGIIAYFAHNPVAANLMMAFIIIMGLVSYNLIQRQMFPNIELNYIDVTASYRGASPQEIEEGILIKIEESLKDVTEIESIRVNAYRNSGQVTLKIDPDAELTDVLDKVKTRVDSIATFPRAMEPLQIRQREFQQPVIEMAVVGDLPLTELKPFAKKVEDELLELSNVSLVRAYTPNDEIAIEVKPEELRRYNLTLTDISNAITNYSANYSAGQLSTDAGLISVRIENQYYQGREFRFIPVKVGNNGDKVLLHQVATIKDGFEEGQHYYDFSGKNAVHINISATKDQSSIPVAETVKKYIDKRNQTLTQGVELKLVVDMTYYLNARLNMMLKNMLQGSILVALMLTIFLRFRVAFWVMVGLPICFLGAMMLMPVFGVTINVLSLFAFIMVLGIVVDDAIVIGESAYREVEKEGIQSEKVNVENVIRGARRVATPATFGVLTTIAVFAPFSQASGPMGDFFYNIAVVVILCLTFSLIESKLILPAHIAHINFTPVKKDSWRIKFNQGFHNFVEFKYQPFLLKCIEWRYLTFATFIGLLMISVGLIAADHVRTVATPSVPEDFPQIRIEMNRNVADQDTIDALQTIEQTVRKVDQKIIKETGSGMVQDILVFNETRIKGTILVSLVDEDLRPFNTFELARRWRNALPAIPGLKSISIKDNVVGNNERGEFGYLLYGSDIETLNNAGRYFLELLAQQPGLFDISSSIDPSNKEIQMQLKPVAYDLGLSLQMVAQQIGSSFFGTEAQRVLRNGEEIRVMVRYPELSREQYSSLKYSVITTPTGQKVMLGDVVNLTEAKGINYIRREEGFRSVYIWGSIDEDEVEPFAVTKDIKKDILPKLKQRFPAIKTELGGSIEEDQTQQDEQILFFIAGMIMVYVLLAVPLKSYFQPFIIMSVIPFSLTGAIWGHFWMGLDISTMSTFGLIAAAGVVINDSLVMTDYVNQMRKTGKSIADSVVAAGCVRFRAITLTSITTFVGVLPILFETSLQAQFVIPMAVGLGFAVLFATLVTLILVPCLYLVLADLSAVTTKLKSNIVNTYLSIYGRTER